MAIRSVSNIRKTIVIPGTYDESDRKAIGDMIIDRIKKRTEAGIDVNGKPFKYAKDSEFKGNNLSDSGDTMEMLEVLDTGVKGHIVIGYQDTTSLEANVAEGQQINIQSQGKYAKPFIGVQKKELDLILAKYQKPKKMTDGESVKNQLLDSFVANLLKTQGL